jgi:hypothetical protein
MKKVAARLILLAASVQAAGIASAQTGVSGSLGLVVYPSGGQAADQQSKDEGECFSWARQSTGVDPADPLAGVGAQPAQQGGPSSGAAAGAGAVGGAARGAIIGNLADEDAGEWAAAGAVVGMARGARRAKQAEAQQQAQAQAQTEAQKSERLDLFKKAFGVCMQGRNYSVS